MIVVCILVVLFLLHAEFRMNEDCSSPAFLSGIVWLWVYFLLLLNLDNVDNSLYYSSFCIAYGCFFIGQNLFASVSNIKTISPKPRYCWHPIVKYFVFIIEYIFAFYVFSKCLAYIGASPYSAWRAIRYAMGDDDFFSKGLFGIALNIVPLAYFIALAIFLNNPCTENRVCLIISLPAVILAFLFSPRGNWFFVLITTAYIILFIKRITNRKILISGVVCFVLILVVWAWSSLDKFELAYQEMSDAEKIKMLFSAYFVNPMLNFVHWFNVDGSYASGLYTFRFICAILNSFGVNVDVVPTVQPFLYLNGTMSNVYTALNWYAHDFGIVWAFIVYFLLGLAYGKIYRKMKYENACDLRIVILLAMLMMPIANQFFDEKIFSIFSIWCQRFITLFILTSPYVLVKKY